MVWKFRLPSDVRQLLNSITMPQNAITPEIVKFVEFILYNQQKENSEKQGIWYILTWIKQL